MGRDELPISSLVWRIVVICRLSTTSLYRSRGDTEIATACQLQTWRQEWFYRPIEIQRGEMDDGKRLPSSPKGPLVLYVDPHPCASEFMYDLDVLDVYSMCAGCVVLISDEEASEYYYAQELNKAGVLRPSLGVRRSTTSEIPPKEDKILSTRNIRCIEQHGQGKQVLSSVLLEELPTRVGVCSTCIAL